MHGERVKILSLSECICEHRWLFEPTSDAKAQTHSTTLAGSAEGGYGRSGAGRTEVFLSLLPPLPPPAPSSSLYGFLFSMKVVI